MRGPQRAAPFAPSKRWTTPIVKRPTPIARRLTASASVRFRSIHSASARCPRWPPPPSPPPSREGSRSRLRLQDQGTARIWGALTTRHRPRHHPRHQRLQTCPRHHPRCSKPWTLRSNSTTFGLATRGRDASEWRLVPSRTPCSSSSCRVHAPCAWGLRSTYSCPSCFSYSWARLWLT